MLEWVSVSLQVIILIAGDWMWVRDPSVWLHISLTVIWAQGGDRCCRGKCTRFRKRGELAQRACRDGLGLSLGVGGVWWVLFSVPRWCRRRGQHVHMIFFLSASCVLCAAWQENTVNPDLRRISCCPTMAGFAWAAAPTETPNHGVGTDSCRVLYVVLKYRISIPFIFYLNFKRSQKRKLHFLILSSIIHHLFGSLPAHLTTKFR